MNQIKRLKCGCEIPIINGKIHIDYDNLNHDCQKTWDLYRTGHTRSIFQLESRLCQNWSKELAPSNIKDAADLISAVRPGTLHSENENGISMTKIFCDRKSGKIIYDKDSPMGKLLETTYGVMLYQEQLMKISKELAGFDSKQATKLMKSVGKKDANLLFSLEQQFIDGCVNNKTLSREDATTTFENIKASSRYLFNACICPTTSFVKTLSGVKNIEDLQIGEFVNSPDGFIEVLDKFDTGIKDLFEIELESGKKIRCTMDHEFLCNDGKKHTLNFILENLLEICEEN